MTHGSPAVTSLKLTPGTIPLAASLADTLWELSNLVMTAESPLRSFDRVTFSPRYI